MFSLESPHRGDSNEYTQYTILKIKKKEKIVLNYPKSAAVCFPRGLKNEFEIASARATECLLYIVYVHHHAFIPFDGSSCLLTCTKRTKPFQNESSPTGKILLTGGANSTFNVCGYTSLFYCHVCKG